jgi:hypothetical protein
MRRVLSIWLRIAKFATQHGIARVGDRHKQLKAIVQFDVQIFKRRTSQSLVDVAALGYE